MKRQWYRLPALAALLVLASAALAAEKREVIRGRIREVNPATHQVTIATHRGKEMTLRVDEHSKLKERGKAVTLEAFKPGMRVRVRFEPHNAENRVVAMTAAAVTAEEVRSAVRAALQAAQSYTFQQKDEYGERLQGVLESVEDRIDQLEEQAEQAGQAAQKDYAPQIDRLRRLRARVEAEAERVKSATPQAWEDLKAGIGSALEDLRKGLDQGGERPR